MSVPYDHQLFVGRLPLGTRVSDLEDIFHRYGKMTRCDVKQGVKMAYGFIEYDDIRDAEDALEQENNRQMCGGRICVEWSRGHKVRRRERDGAYGGGGRRSRHYSDSPDRDRDRRRSRSRERRYSPDRRGDRDYHSSRRKSPDRHYSPDYERRSRRDHSRSRSRSYD